MLDDKALKFIEGVVRTAGDRLLKSKPTVMSYKNNNDLLTENDVANEEYIVSEIRRELPHLNVISEEKYAHTALAGETIVIDPVDGTCNFVMGLPLCGVQVAYFSDGVCLASMVYLPSYNEFYLAVKGKGCFLNDKRITINTSYDHSEGFLIISDYYSGQEIPMHKQFALVEALQPHFLKTRHYGPACIDFTSIVKTNALAYVTYYNEIWDIAPGLLLVEEAGGVYADLAHDVFDYRNKGIAVANNSKNLEFILSIFRSL